MKKTTRSLIVLLIVAMFFFISCDDTLTHDMDDDVDDDEQVVATRTVTWVNYDGEVVHTADVEKYKAPDHSIVPIPEKVPSPTCRLEFDEAGDITVTEDIVYQYKFREWFSQEQNRNGGNQVFTATYDTYDSEGNLADLSDFIFKSTTDNPYTSKSAHFCRLTEYNGTDKEDLYIPKFYKGELVVTFKADLRDDVTVKRLILPDSVLELSGGGFQKNKSLLRLIITNNLRTIAIDSFEFCKTLLKVNILEGIETETYAGKAYQLGDNDNFGIPRIGMFAFYGCTNLTHIDIPDTIEAIYKGAFADCEKLQNVNMPETPKIKEINDFAFMDCKALENIVIPLTVEIIGDGAFNSSGLNHILIPAKVKEIMPLTFADCIALTKITLSEGLETIRRKAFENCNALTSLTIPSTVTEIEGSVIIGCESLGSITVSPGNNVYSDRGNDVIYHVDDRTLIAGCKNSKIPAGTKHIAESAFDGHAGLTKDPGIGIPSLESIGARAFWGCLDNGAIQSIDLHENLTTIGSGAFYHEEDYLINPETGLKEGISNKTRLFSPYTVHTRNQVNYGGACAGGVGIYYYSPEWKMPDYHHWTDIWREEDNPALKKD